MAGRKHTDREYAQLLIDRIGRYCQVGEVTLQPQGVSFSLTAGEYGYSAGPMGIPRGSMNVTVQAGGRVQVVYETICPCGAQSDHDVLWALNRLNAQHGVTYWVEGSPWSGARLRARSEFYIERFEGCFASKVSDRILLMAADVAHGLSYLSAELSEFFSDEEMDRAAAEANLSPEELLCLPEEVEVPEEEEGGGFFAEEAFFEEESEPFMPEWYEEWGDEAEFMQKYRDMPLDRLSGSELIRLQVALQRDTCRLQIQLEKMLGARSE